jgi:small GTP-binding protein
MRKPWPEQTVPTIQDWFETDIDVSGTPFHLKIIDTAGKDEMQAITAVGIREADVCLIVYSVASELSFSEAESVGDRIIASSRGSRPRIALVGNKTDLRNRAVPTRDAEALARRWGCKLYEASAKEDRNVQQLFKALVRPPSPRAWKNSVKKTHSDFGAMCVGCTA